MALLALASGTSRAAEPAATIIEYFNAPANKYFITANPADWSALDGLANIGWKRTGVTWAAYSAGQQADAQPVCRLYIPSVSSHFFSANTVECAQLAALPGFVNEGVAWYALPATAGTCPGNSAGLYRTFNNGGGNGPANHRYFTDYSFYQSYAARGYALEGLSMCLPLSSAEKRLDAVRLLRQASFGPTPAEIDRVTAMGSAAWLNEQFVATASRFTPRDYYPQTRPEDCVNSNAQPVTPTSYCQRDNYTLFPVQLEFYKQAIGGNDQLRQRLAWALSQLFVVSVTDVNLSYGMGDYQQMLRDNAFSNFRTLLERVTLHPAMGRFLDMANNQKPDAAKGIAPNENYAREILQLFSVGVNLLNDDGSEKKGADGKPIEAYTQDEIEGFAHVFTGWTYPTRAGSTPNPNRLNGQNLAGSMESRENFHDTGSKDLLGSTVAPAGTLAYPDLTVALDTIFNYSNVPPFVSRFLIQKLVTGSPSPGYVQRVAAVFRNNGSGVRGDMKAVTTAILTDIEARGAAKYEPSYGHLNEPVLMITSLARALGAKTDGFYFYNSGNAMAQGVYSAPSVFNYYAPDHVINSVGINSPEFGIFNSATALSRINFAQSTLYNTIGVSNQLYGATGTQFDWTPYTSVATDSNALLDRVNEVMFAGKMSALTRAVIKPAIDAVPAGDGLGRARAALYLAIAAPEAQIVR